VCVYISKLSFRRRQQLRPSRTLRRLTRGSSNRSHGPRSGSPGCEKRPRPRSPAPETPSRPPPEHVRPSVASTCAGALPSGASTSASAARPKKQTIWMQTENGCSAARNLRYAHLMSAEEVAPPATQTCGRLTCAPALNTLRPLQTPKIVVHIGARGLQCAECFGGVLCTSCRQGRVPAGAVSGVQRPAPSSTP
jgi:hypothetical protein